MGYLTVNVGDMFKATYDPNANGFVKGSRPNVIASDDLLGSVDAEVSLDVTTYTLATGKELTLTAAGMNAVTLRIKFDMHTTSSDGAYGKIYKNDVAVGTEQYTTSDTYVTYSEDIAGWSNGDKIQLYIHEADSGYATYVRNFRVYGKIDDTDPSLSVA